MIVVQPSKVVHLKIVSGSDKFRRELDLGYFKPNIEIQELDRVFKEAEILPLLLSGDNLDSGEGSYNYHFITTYIDRGVIFEHPTECVQMLRAKLTPKELFDIVCLEKQQEG